MNYYHLLGVHKGSTTVEINAAFRKLAWRHHPDQGGEPAAFAALVHAKATLTDDRLKMEYDRMLLREFEVCKECAGDGYHAVQKGFTKRQKVKCKICNGCGVKHEAQK